MMFVAGLESKRGRRFGIKFYLVEKVHSVNWYPINRLVCQLVCHCFVSSSTSKCISSR